MRTPGVGTFKVLAAIIVTVLTIAAVRVVIGPIAGFMAVCTAFSFWYSLLATRQHRRETITTTGNQRQAIVDRLAEGLPPGANLALQAYFHDKIDGNQLDELLNGPCVIWIDWHGEEHFSRGRGPA